MLFKNKNNKSVYTQRHMHISFMCVWGEGGGGMGGGDFLRRAKSERVSDFVEIVTFHCMYVYMSIVRYGLFCIG